MLGIWVAVNASTLNRLFVLKKVLKSWKSRPAAPAMITRSTELIFPPR
jgi:hypothetical protein